MDKKIFDYNVDDTFDLFLLVKNADVRVAKNGKKFIAFTFQDVSGQIDGKYWDASDSDIEAFLAGKVVRVSGKRELYQGNPQVKLFKIRLANDNEPNSPELFMERAPIKKEEIVEEINQTIFEITNANMNRVVRHLMTKYQKEFFQFPAAKKHHHAYMGGLSYHTISMLRLAKFIAEQYPEINKPLLYSGVILHDLGKVMELSGAMSTEYTLEGNLIGHIVIVDEEITKACLALKIDDKSEDIILLKHMILAHHGQLEYGSPVRPRLREAEVLHQIDNIDASINMLNVALNRTEPGTFTERIFGMDNRAFYKPNMAKVTSEEQLELLE
ncbi:3'-5' exonuclease [Carnobacterium maltaromaticum]|uniref:3'-5' exoribonuclease YhaM family protein n=1 Tax=Carnobacterium maltaromaticum TaxID=2751 RepID=UPI000C7748B4|nr:HD domain-containing protein [Carnobacterium maltaromaticum]PLS33881.1 3'-5' exonuclease [Carnobacterium maltaromaticum]PLS35862.1 3'-5' exonuclease [Carnobacterium maltaromaticum]PLS36312.1 3'-5' exonuclease [Carnobacterium maltaromaticum]PLS42769.1 3'-5' exonuclease [Carnobacterium maltaromaticum]PLS43005.1 3'-5' exonuclease [Carnobacterium maltaromaticum]